MTTARSSSVATASRAARLVRRVHDWEQCRSRGIERLLEQGAYRHPQAAGLDPDAEVGVLLFKAAVRVTRATLLDLEERTAECGYVIAEGRSVPTSLIRERGLVRRHYQVHETIAERGRLRADERLELLRTYDHEEFQQRFGRRAHEVPVVPVGRFLLQTGIPVEEINRWSETCAHASGLDSGSIDAANEVGDCKHVNVFRHPLYSKGEPVFLLNPHMPSVLDSFERANAPLLVLLLLAASKEALAWPDLRRLFCGASDPARAQPGSLRRDALEGLFPLPLESGEPIDRTRNGVHLSDGPVEALREIVIWFERDPESTSIGRTLAHDPRIDLRGVVERPFVELDGRIRTLKQATNGRTIEEVRQILRGGRLLDIDLPDDNAPTLTRVDIAHELSRDLRADHRVEAVFATGSVSRNRAMRDSDLNMVVVAAVGDSVTAPERRELRGVAVRIERMCAEHALAIARGCGRADLAALRDAAALGFALPVHDPHRLGSLYEREARGLRPAPREIGGRLGAVSRAIRSLRDSSASAEHRWLSLRTAYDHLAVLALLLHPIRFGKIKWIWADLLASGWASLAEELLRAHHIHAPERAHVDDLLRFAEITVTRAESVAGGSTIPCASIASSDTRPGDGEALRCCLADASALSVEGRLREAHLTASLAIESAERFIAAGVAPGAVSKAPWALSIAHLRDRVGTAPPSDEIVAACELRAKEVQARADLLTVTGD